MWVKKPYKSYKGFRWVWVPESPKNEFDETTLNRPKAKTQKIVWKKRAHIKLII